MSSNVGSNVSSQPFNNSIKNSIDCQEDSQMDEEIISEFDYSWSDVDCFRKNVEYKIQNVKLLELPEEILYLIFSFINTSDLIICLKPSCKLFNQMLNECYFKRRMKKFLKIKDKEMPRALKALSIDYGDHSVSWNHACLKYEGEFRKWSDPNFSKIRRMDFSNNTSSVDVARILCGGRLAMTGGRDRILSLWNIDAIPRLINFNARAHSGWIWDVISSGDNAISCDWDGKICQWSLERDITDPESIYQIERPVLCLALVEDYNLLVAGLQTGELCFIDTRNNESASHRNERIHRSAIMGLQMSGSSIVSISEDKTISVYDLKACKQMRKSRITGSSIPVSMSKINNAIYIAQTNGCITLINSSTYKIWDTFSAVNSRLTSIHASNLGALITSSRDKHITIYSPGKTLIPIRHLNIGAEAAKIDYNHGILAVARSDNKVTIFNSNILIDQSSE